MSDVLMASRKTKRSAASRAIAQAIIEQYQPKSAEDMQDALRDIFGPMFEAMLQGEMDSHLGYETNEHGYKETSNRRNGYTHKSIKTSMGEVEIDAPVTETAPLPRSSSQSGQRMSAVLRIKYCPCMQRE